MKLNITRLESERKKLKMSKAKFSRHLGMTDSSYNKLMQRESTGLKGLARISEVLKLELKELLK